MVVDKILTKIIQTVPSWEVTKYYGRVCWFQLKCMKYRIQTSEAWFNFRCKFMPGSFRDESKLQDAIQKENKIDKFKNLCIARKSRKCFSSQTNNCQKQDEICSQEQQQKSKCSPKSPEDQICIKGRCFNNPLKQQGKFRFFPAGKKKKIQNG